MNNVYIKRIRRVKLALRSISEKATLLLSSAPVSLRSASMEFHYRQNSDFYYLTGSESANQALLISNSEKKPILFALKPRTNSFAWEEENVRSKKIAADLDAKLVKASSLQKVILPYLQQCYSLYFQNVPGTTSWQIARYLMEIPSNRRRAEPVCFNNSDILLQPLRLFKDSSEVALIKEAIKITHQALDQTVPLLRSGKSEAEAAACLEYEMKLRNARLAFPCCVATGRSTVFPHYQSHKRKFKNKDIAWIDCGAEYKRYAGDITRAFPIGGKFSELQLELYMIVLEAQQAAMAKIKDGVKFECLLAAAARVITEGLLDLGVLRGKVSSLMAKKAYQEYLPHQISHSLGLDVHDIGPGRKRLMPNLGSGMVITVEPAIYFRKKIGNIPACGIRIEDDVLVTKSGHKNLSAAIPKHPEDVEDWLSR